MFSTNPESLSATSDAEELVSRSAVFVSVT